MMTKIPSSPAREPTMQRQATWGGTSRSDREGFLSNHNLGVKTSVDRRAHRWDVVVNVLIGLVLFSAVVIGCAVIWPSYLHCHRMQQTTGLIGGQSLTTCTIQTSLWWHAPAY